VGAGIEKVRALAQAVAQEAEFKGWQPKIIELQMNKPLPDVGEARDWMATTLIANPGVIVNLSGGSRMMSIGAYNAALVLGRPTFFCDTEGERFVNGRTGPSNKMPEFRETANRMSLRLLMAMRGKNFADFRSEPTTDALRAFGLKAFELRNKQWNALEHFNKGLRAHFYGPGDRLPTTPEELNALLIKPLPPQLCQNDASRTLLLAAQSAGLAREEAQSFKIVASPVKASVERTVQLIMNRWIELAVLDCVLRNPRYRDAHWNLTLTSQTSTDASEADIICVDQDTSSLRLISCKSTIDRSPLDQLENIAARAAKVGATTSTFVLFKPAQGQESAIRSAARRMNIDVALEADEIVKAFSPSVK
jgi:hypothetical protein